MANVLIATLGEVPVVVASMIHVLRERKGIELDQAHILYPNEPNA